MKRYQKGEVMVVMMVVMLVIWLSYGHGNMGMMGHGRGYPGDPKEAAQQEKTPAPAPPEAAGNRQ